MELDLLDAAVQAEADKVDVANFEAMQTGVTGLDNVRPKPGKRTNRVAQTVKRERTVPQQPEGKRSLTKKVEPGKVYKVIAAKVWGDDHASMLAEDPDTGWETWYYAPINAVIEFTSGLRPSRQNPYYCQAPQLMQFLGEYTEHKVIGIVANRYVENSRFKTYECVLEIVPPNGHTNDTDHGLYVTLRGKARDVVKAGTLCPLGMLLCVGKITQCKNGAYRVETSLAADITDSVEPIPNAAVNGVDVPF